jgi:mycothiol S-conjugate amidase
VVPSRPFAASVDLRDSSAGPAERDAGNVAAMEDRLCLLTVHAHPDDESSKGPGTVARYHAEGVHTVLVCCTGGEEGDILNPGMDRPEVRERLPEIRMRELEEATRIIGYDEVVLLGYRDSGMPGTPSNSDPRSFASAPAEEAVGRLVGHVRRTRPQVMIVYGDDQRGYPHPDHLKAHEIGVAAFDAAGDPDSYPEAGPAWQPLKLYYTVWSRARMLAVHERFLELGLESPFDPKRFEDVASLDDKITTSVSLEGYTEVRQRALKAHATQVDPSSPFWFGLPPEVSRGLEQHDDYVLARSLLGRPEGRETDLFEGVRRGAGQLGSSARQ